MIPRMDQLALNTVPGQTQPTIEFPAENQENPGENAQQNFQNERTFRIRKNIREDIRVLLLARVVFGGDQVCERLQNLSKGESEQPGKNGTNG